MIKTLRASGSRLQADVVIGKNQYGSDVTVQLTVERTEPGVQEALVLLNEALVKVAEGMVDTAVHEQVVQQRVREQVAAQVGPAKLVAQRNADQRVLDVVQQTEKILLTQQDGTLPAYAVTRLRSLLEQVKAHPDVKAKAG